MTLLIPDATLTRLKQSVSALGSSMLHCECVVYRASVRLEPSFPSTSRKFRSFSMVS
jgi:hypothetical protein